MSIIIIFIIFVVSLCIISYMLSDNTSILDPDMFPEYSILVSNKDVILKELFNCISTNIWTYIDHNNILDSIIYKDIPILDIYEYTIKHNSALNVGSPSLRTFIITMNRDQLVSNSFYCKETSTMIQNIHNVQDAMFMCLEPSVRIPSHSSNRKNILRCLIPLVIPYGDSGVNIGGENIKWSTILQNKKFIIFDESYSHYMWNNTNENVYVLFIEITK